MKWRPEKGGKKRPNVGAIKIIVEKHADGYVAYPLGMKGIVVGQGDTYQDAMTDVKSAIRSHVEAFGNLVAAI